MKHFFKFLGILMTMLTLSTSVFADYTDVPFTIKSNGQFSYSGDTGSYTFSTKTGYYQEWDHYVIFWSTGYGSKTGTVTTIGSGDYLLNLTQMQQYAELCYENYINLGFLTPAHKIIILAYYTTDWEATGSGEGAYGLLNISHASANPSATNPYYTYCHEIAHAYQYLGNQKNGGNAGFQYGTYYGYVSYYECCGNWQAAQEYPALYFPQSMGIYNKTTNLNWLHSWHCYQSYIFNDYFTEKCGQTTIGDIWTVNTSTKYADPLEKYMYNTGATAEDVYREIFYAAMRTVTWDLTRWDNYLSAQGVSRDRYMDHRMGAKAGTNGATTTPVTYSDTYYPTASTYQYVTTNSSSAIHQVAYSSCPQSTGFNVIKLNVPTGTNRTVTTTFTALAPGASLASGDNKEYWCGSMWAKSSSQTNYNTGGLTSEATTTYNTYKSWRGFRLGYVTYKKSTGKRYYNFSDQVYCTGTSETSVNIQFDVPSDVDSLYLVVSPALSNYLRTGSVDPYSISSNANYVSTQQSLDQWPYRVQFYGTNIYGLSNPSTTFSGTAVTGTTYTSETLPDLAGDTTEKTYTIQLASGSPAGAGFTVTSDLTSIGNSQYTTTITLTASNVAGYVTPATVEGYRASIAVSGQTITITYEEVGPSLTIQRNVTIPIDSDYSGTTVTLTSTELSSIASFLGITSANFMSSSNWSDWSETGPTTGKLMFYAVNPDGETLEQRGSTANGYGHWFNTSGEVIAYGDGGEALFSEYTATTGVFNIGQFPDALAQGSTYTIRQAAVYNKSGVNYIVYFVFNVSMAASGTTPSTTYSYTVNVVNNPGSGGITPKTGLTLNTSFGTYECSTELTSSNIATYATAITVSGYSATLSVSGSVITVTYTLQTSDPTITASPVGISFADAYVGQSYTQNLTVSGTNLTGNISITKSGSSSFSIDKTTITRSGTSASATVTVTYSPTEANSHTGTLTLTSSGATTVTVSLAGTATIEPVDPVTTTVTIYQLTSTLTAGEEYLVVSGNAAGSAYALGHSGTTVAADGVTVKAADDISDVLYISDEDVDETSVWTVAGTSTYTLQNGSYYVGTTTSGTRTLRISTTSTNWTWDSSNNYLYYKGNRSSYYLRYNNGFSVSSTATNIYLYKKTTATIAQDVSVDLSASIDIYAGRDAYTATLTWEPSSTEFQTILSTFGLSSMSDFNDHYDSWYEELPTSHADGTILLYGQNADSSLYSDGWRFTANQGFWYDTSGYVCNWGATDGDDNVVSAVFMELDRNLIIDGSGLQFTFGQYDGVCSAGDQRTVRAALRYLSGGSYRTVNLIFTLNFIDVTNVEIPEDDAAMSLNFTLVTPRNTEYGAQYVTMTETQAASINSFFGVEDFSSFYINDFGIQSAGTMMYYAVNPDGTLANSTSTQYNPGHWFDADDYVCNWGDDARVWIHFFSEETEINEDGDTAPAKSFEIGQMGLLYDEDENPIDLLANGTTYTPTQALRYYDGTQYRTVYFHFTITIGDGEQSHDVNKDGNVDFDDVPALVEILLGRDNVAPYQYDHDAADVNGNDTITISDVTELVNRLRP